MLTDAEKSALERATAVIDSIAFPTTDGMFDSMLADAATLRALIERVGWQPIETAPKDGRKVDLWVAGFERGSVRWPDAKWMKEGEHRCTGPANWCLDGFPLHGFIAKPKATHWMPLPTPPTE